MADKYRLITRSDFDGLVCAVILKDLDLIHDIDFVHPKDVQDGKVPVTNKDITANLPYARGVYLAFDHHASEVTRVGRPDNYIIDPNAPSAARVVYGYYGGKKKLPGISDDLMAAVDKSDSAQFTREEILDPQGWNLLSFIMDARTGLGRFHDFKISNKDLMKKLIELIRKTPLPQILQDPDIKERVDLYQKHSALNAEQIERCAKLHANLMVLDLRNEETIYAGNRFMPYALSPQSNISLHVMWGKEKKNVAIACGKSILKRDSKTNVGELMLKYGGGGHKAAGTCQVPADKADKVLKELVEQITKDG
ncbi:MAG: exopolyphosphatase [Planctomycetes bacterium]|nr:exopolyphosphatase [Planctomycetota bacterium]